MATPSPPPAATPPPSPPQPRWWRKVPTPLIVTLLGAALTVLVLPAVTRQWDERQRALDLKTGLVSQISIATGRSITSAETLFETYNGKTANFEESTSRVAPGLPLRRGWLSDKLKIEGKLRAYFSPQLFRRWSTYDHAMVNFLYLAGVEGRMNRGRRQAERKNPGDPPPLNSYDSFSINLYLGRLPQKQTGLARLLLTRPRLTDRRSGFLALEGVILDMEASFTNQLLAAEPRGFSTTRRDLINDLLP